MELSIKVLIKSDLLPDLAIAHLNLGNGVCDKKNYSEAIQLYDRAIAITEKLFFQEGRIDLDYHLAIEYNNKAATLEKLDRTPEAIVLLEKSIDIYETLVYDRDLTEQIFNLSSAYMNLARALEKIDRTEESQEFFSRYKSVMLKLMNEKKRSENPSIRETIEAIKAGILVEMGMDSACQGHTCH